jgi:phage shock protein C
MTSPQIPEPRRLHRSPTDRKLGGVCGGLADYLHIDPTLLRVIVIVACVFTFPVGPVAYLLAWLIMPEDRSGWTGGPGGYGPGSGTGSGA